MIETALALLNTKAGASLASGLGSGLGGALGGGSAGPSNAQSGAYGSGLDGSGWSVNFAGVQNSSSDQDKSGGVPGVGVSGVAGSIPSWAWLVLAGAVLWRLRKSK
jgi:hypothetical protein